MKVNGIVAEYNPFHNGHKYHIEKSKLETGADYTIVALSGNFVQRGAPALADKYCRAQMALENGADLVLELPVIYAASSAEYFATGAVSLFDRLGVVTHLSFGSECGNLDILEQIARILSEEPPEYQSLLQSGMRQGLSYPTARTEAILQYCPSLSNYHYIFTSPNNILGIEYLKALYRRKSPILPATIQRTGAAYHNTVVGTQFCSAMAIRHALFAGQDMDFLNNQMPENAYHILQKFFAHNAPLDSNAFSTMLHYKLLSDQDSGYSSYLDVSRDLSGRIGKNLEYFTDFNSFCEQLKSKEMTYTRISRCLFHILLNIRALDLERAKALDYAPYARVLGFRRDASELLTAIKEKASIPLLTKPSEAHQMLTNDALAMFRQDIFASEVYKSALTAQKGEASEHECRTPLVIV